MDASFWIALYIGVGAGLFIVTVYKDPEAFKETISLTAERRPDYPRGAWVLIYLVLGVLLWPFLLAAAQFED